MDLAFYIGKGVWRQMIITSHFLSRPLGPGVNGDELMLSEDFNGVLGGLNPEMPSNPAIRCGIERFLKLDMAVAMEL